MSCQELLLSTVATLKRVFPAVVVLSIGYRNRLLLAFAKETPAASIRAAQQVQGRRSNYNKRLARQAAAQDAEFQVPARTIAFTDDFAAVQEMARRMLNRN